MAVITATNLRKVFRVARKPEGGWARLAATFRPRYVEQEAVRGLSLTVEKGESLAFIGPNGAGKSTTIKMLTGILHPTSGEARVLGYVPWLQRQELAFRIGSVFGQKSQLWLHLPPVDTFNLLARIYELDWSDYLRRRAELVELFELGDLMYTPVRKLSLGQRMRCEIAASLLHRPEILFLDEPTIGLDPVAKGAIRELIRRANREEGVTVFLTSHDAGDIEQVCRRVIIVSQGQVVLDDTVNALRRDYLTTKEIDLKLGVPFAGGIDLPGVSVIKARGYGVKLSVDTGITPIDRVISHILRQYPVQDITIQNPPMEAIIAAIYRGKAVNQ
ncbi:MAG: ATP-binding cassette domain-containing protein [Firmicutes bacterium]|nr:ATP-binding cassette domain-containing protein [Bacillota bacterium]